jgi:type I restriction enzyme S subunit
MNPDLLLAHFDRISDAPDAIPRLRRFILDLAVRGRLVEQDSTQEPASALLMKIQSEKARLIKAGEIRLQRPLPPLEQDEVPFLLPHGWIWTRIRQVTSDRGQKIPNKDFTYIDVTAINKEEGAIAEVNVLAAADAPSRARKIAQTGDVLYSCVRPYLLNVAVIESEIVPAPIASTAFAVLNGFGLVLARYMWIVLRSPFMVECVEAKMRGQAYPAINDSDFARLPFPLPPLAEQHSIVAKVDELMTLCERLEAASNERERRQDRLTAATLYQLNDGANAEAFRGHADFCLAHFPLLTKSSAQIKHLRQTILNLAVRGLLVPQDPKDESAARLLGERRLIANSEPWKLPSGWAWSSFSLIGETLGGGTPSKAHPEFWKGAIPWVSPKDMKVDVITDSQDHISAAAVEQSAVRLIPTGSLLVVVRGMILAHSFPTAATEVPVTINQDMKAIVPFRADLIRFLVLLTKGLKPEVLRLVLRSTHGTCKLLTDDLFSLPIPIPPLAEQGRILAKVNELMALCDRLEATLSSKRGDAARLLEALLHSALPTAGIPRDGLDGFEMNVASAPLSAVPTC